MHNQQLLPKYQRAGTFNSITFFAQAFAAAHIFLIAGVTVRWRLVLGE
jgi:hypothetical protein